MIIPILLSERPGKIDAYLTEVRFRHRVLPAPLFDLKINRHCLKTGEHLVLFSVNFKIPVVYAILLIDLLSLAGGYFLWHGFYYLAAFFAMFLFFVSDVFVWYGIRRGWKQFSSTKPIKLSHKKALKLLLSDGKLWDR